MEHSCIIFRLNNSYENTKNVTNGNDGCFPLQFQNIDTVQNSVKLQDSKYMQNEIDNDAFEIVQQYGSYLNLDLMAVVCSLSELPISFDAVLVIAGSDEEMQKESSSLGKL